MSTFGYQSLMGLSSIDADIVDTNTLVVEKDLTVNGNSALQNLILPTGAVVDDVLTCISNSGNTAWKKPADSVLVGDVTGLSSNNVVNTLANGTIPVSSLVSMTGAQTLTNKTLGYTVCSKNINMNNQIQNKMIALYDGGILADQTRHDYIGLGNSSSTFRFHCIDTSTDFAFFNAISSTASNNTFRVKGNGNVGIGNGSSLGIGAANPMNTLDVDGNSTFGPTTSRAYRIIDSTAIINAFSPQSGSGNFLRLVREGVGKIDINCSTGSYGGVSKHIDFIDTDNGSVIPLSLAIDGSKQVICGGNITMVNGRLDITTGSTGNIGIGTSTLAGNTSGTSNTAVGYQALSANNSTSNTAIGYNSMATAIGSSNVAVGDSTLIAASGNSNVAVGQVALAQITTGNSNTAIGNASTNYNLSGSGNTCIGASSGLGINTCSNNTCIGKNANVSGNTVTNSTAIGYGAIVTASNTIQLGNTSTVNVVTSGGMIFGGGGSSLNNYEEYIHNTYFVGPVIAGVYGLRIVRVGNMVTLYMPNSPQLGITASGWTSWSIQTVLPSRFRPGTAVNTLMIGLNNNVAILMNGVIDNAGNLIITMPLSPGASFTGIIGFSTFSVSWTL